MTAFIGIDLGTTFSAVAALDDTGRPTIVHNNDGRNLTPSCVAQNDGVIVVGDEARRTYNNTPDRVAARFKRDMGSQLRFRVADHEFSPTELSTFVLKKLLQDTKAALGEVGQAVVTIPANFSNEAREATMAAAKAAGLDVQFIINEPTAAALYYAFKSGEELHGHYAVYDLGGGTFDVSIIRVEGQQVDVVSSNGVTRLGGDDFDEALRAVVAQKYKAATGEDMDPDDFSKSDAEQEKISLSQRQRTTVKVARQLVDITRADLEEAISSRITQAEMLCEATLDEAGIASKDVQKVFLAGGSTRMPLVRESVKRVFGQEPVATVNVDEVVALGAALYAAYRGDKARLSPVQKKAIEKIKVSETTTKSFGTITLSHDPVRSQSRLINAVLINKGDKIPCSITQSFYTVHDGQTSVDCSVTESTAPETDPKFVRVVWEGVLGLPPHRPKEQEIRVTYAYDENQIMSCSFLDVSSGVSKTIDLSMATAASIDSEEIEKFLVE